MQNNRKKKQMNHRSGKVPFIMRAERHLTKRTSRAQHVSAFGDAYSGDPIGAEIVAVMNEEVRKLTEDPSGLEDASGLEEPLPTETQIEIITKAVGSRKGTRVSGGGNDLKRPPRPRGGATNHALRMALIRAQEESALKEAEFEKRIKALEESMLRGQGTHQSSEGASCDRQDP